QGAISAYAQEAVLAVQEAGLMNGLGNGSFAPKGETTRAQAAVTIYRVMNSL
ncbi:S-layer homology domain-containing protein, partial [Paenibacillus sp. DLE-14]|nr:S-layer homology domain-containing protein [Paenibacillus lignilyticus]